MTHAVANTSSGPDPVAIRAETPSDAAAIERVIMDAFGPGRFAKTAERLREGAIPAAGWVATLDGRVVGAVRLWPMRIGETEALFLGPIAVDAGERQHGVGARLVEHALAEAEARGLNILLVGDEPYFGRFGFAVAPDVVLPGPVDRRRVLWRGQGAPSGVVQRG